MILKIREGFYRQNSMLIDGNHNAVKTDKMPVDQKLSQLWAAQAVTFGKNLNNK